jgi:hypothetical protein
MDPRPQHTTSTPSWIGRKNIRSLPTGNIRRPGAKSKRACPMTGMAASRFRASLRRSSRRSALAGLSWAMSRQMLTRSASARGHVKPWGIVPPSRWFPCLPGAAFDRVHIQRNCRAARDSFLDGGAQFLQCPSLNLIGARPGRGGRGFFGRRGGRSRRRPRCSYSGP